MGVRRGSCVALIACALSLPAVAQIASKGSLLVASPSSTDPELAATVILVLRSDAQGAVGLILNQPTSVPVSTLFPKAKSMVLYKGGPLRMGINGLVRETRPVAGESRVFGDVYLISSKPDLEARLLKSPPGFPLRVYVGLCGWTAGQLADEIRRGVWSVRSASAAIVFAETSPRVFRGLR